MQKFIKYGMLTVCIVLFAVFFKLYIDILGANFVYLSAGAILGKIVRLIVCMALFCVIYILLGRNAGIIEKYQWVILLCFLLFLFAAQMILGERLRVIPRFDFSAVYDGAVEWLVKGSFPDFYEYYYHYPNNLGELSFLLVLFLSASKFGCQDFYFVGMLVNSLLSIAMVLGTFLLCKRFFSAVEAVFSLVIFGLCPPMYLLAPVFYSDELTMVFPVWLLLLSLYYEEKDRGVLRDGLFALGIALVGFAGYMIKPTAFIAGIAALLMLCLKGKWKKMLLLLGSVLMVFTALTCAKNAYFYGHHLDREVAEQKNTPLEVWIYMGLNENLGFSEDDTEFAKAIEDPQKRREVVREKIAERIRDYGPEGMYRHLKNKGATVFGDGTFELSASFVLGFARDTGWKEVLTTLGKHYDAYWDFCTLPWYTVILLGVFCEGCMCFGIWGKTGSALGERMHRSVSLFPVALSLFGLYLFLMIWEVHPRYAVNHYGFFVIMAVGGLYCLFGPERKKHESAENIG